MKIEPKLKYVEIVFTYCSLIHFNLIQLHSMLCLCFRFL